MAYATVNEAITYFESRLYTDAWDIASPSDRTKALGHATRLIDNLAFVGAKTDAGQVNEFPRNGDSEVPEAIKQATCEIALALLEGKDPERELEDLSTTSHSYTGVRSTYDRGFAQAHKTAMIPSPTAWVLLKPYLRDPGTIKISKV